MKGWSNNNDQGVPSYSSISLYEASNFKVAIGYYTCPEYCSKLLILSHE